MDSYDDSLGDNQPIDNQPTHCNAPTCTFGAGHHSYPRFAGCIIVGGCFMRDKKIFLVHVL